MNKYLTPLDDCYATCERTRAVLRIHCGERSPNDMTEYLSIEPTETVEVGVAKPRRNGKLGPPGKVNLWLLDSEQHMESKDLRRHIDWVLDQLDPAAERILKLREAGLLIDIWCVWWSSTGQGGPALWPKQMARVALLDLELSIDFAYFGEQ